jgi:hypothetical protein
MRRQLLQFLNLKLKSVTRHSAIKSQQWLYNMNIFLCNQMTSSKTRFSTSTRQNIADKFQGIPHQKVSSFETVFQFYVLRFCFEFCLSIFFKETLKDNEHTGGNQIVVVCLSHHKFTIRFVFLFKSNRTHNLSFRKKLPFFCNFFKLSTDSNFSLAV